MYKYVFFDYDGTIMDTNAIIIKCLNQTAKEFNSRELSEHELHDILGLYLDIQMQKIVPAHWESAVGYYRDMYESLQETMVKPFEGCFDLLSMLKDADVSMAVISAKSRDTLNFALQNFDISKYFECVISSQDIVNNKPHPEPILKAIDFFGADKNQCIMVGDSPYDILCAVNAKISSCLVNWTIFPKHKFAGITPSYCADTPNDIYNLVVNNLS